MTAAPNLRFPGVFAFCLLAAAASLAGCGDGKSLADHIAESSGSGGGATAAAPAGGDSYSDRIAGMQQRRVGDQRAEFFERAGQGNAVEVVVTGVTGDPAAAGTYLRKKLFKAAYDDYANAAKQAQQQTEANRKAAAQAALDEHKKTWGDGFGPTMVWYQYKPVESSLSYPSIESGPAGDGTFTFFASPVLDLNAFAKRYDVGQVTNIDAANRRIEIRSLLPDPVPDFDVEQLMVQHGANGVATLTVTNAAGDPQAVGTYLNRQASQLDPAINLYVVGPRLVGRDTYELTIAPVGDLNAFSDRIRFGRVTTLDPAKRALTVSAELPNPLPTAAVAGSTGAAGDTRNLTDWSDFDKAPQPGESTIDWALRIVKGRGLYADRALTELASMTPDPNELPRVSEVLVATFDGQGLNVERHLDAMVTWKTPEAARKIADKMTEDWAGHQFDKFVSALDRMKMPEASNAAAEAIRQKIVGDRTHFRLDENLNALERLGRPEVAVQALKVRIEQESAGFGDKTAIQALTRFKTPEAAEAVASQLGHNWVGKDASVALKQMGEAAEPVAIRLLTHRAPLVRAEAANILYEVGTQKAVDALAAAISREKEAAVKVHLRDARKALVQKLQAGT
ncbi:MAG TPA: HEAT repeat domain-containing protein [Planctomycetaceae bacterium]